MAKILRIACWAVIVIFLYFVAIKPFLAPQYYRRIIDLDFREKIEAVFSNKSGKEEIIRKKILPDEARELLSWGDRLVTVEQVFETKNNIYKSRDVIAISRDNGTTWQNFSEGDELCDFATIHSDKLICVAIGWPLRINVFKADGFSNRKNLIRSASILEVLRDEKNLYIIWRDERARWPTWWAFVPVPNSHTINDGPYLIMAGKLNLETLDFEEHAIGYDMYDLKELFVNDAS